MKGKPHQSTEMGSKIWEKGTAEGILGINIGSLQGSLEDLLLPNTRGIGLETHFLGLGLASR